MQAYSNPKRQNDPHALPDLELFQLTAEESVEYDEDTMYEALKRFPLASMNSREHDKAIAWAVEESGTEGGWYYWYCTPGCLPDSEPYGPFPTPDAAIADARENNADDDESEAR